MHNDNEIDSVAVMAKALTDRFGDSATGATVAQIDLATDNTVMFWFAVLATLTAPSMQMKVAANG